MRRLLGVKVLSAFALALAVSGCIPSTRTPERLYPVTSEMDTVRLTDGALAARYYGAVLSPNDAKAIRNEIIAQRMYAIDVQYTQYETALTREVQEVGFAALTSAEGLTTAATLVGNVATKSALSAVATAVLATRGHYNSEILLAQTIRTIQKQMRASRNIVAANIAAKVALNTVEYPLAAALSDVEEYYNAGTLTTGVIDTSTTVGIKEDLTKDVKQRVNEAPAEQRATILRDARDPVVVPLRSVIINDVRAPLAETQKRGSATSRTARGGDPSGPSGPTNTGARPSFEDSLKAADIRAFQIALCVNATGLIDAPTRSAIASYFDARGKVVPQTINQRNYNFLSEAVEKVDVEKGGTCSKRGFANAAAVGAAFPR